MGTIVEDTQELIDSFGSRECDNLKSTVTKVLENIAFKKRPTATSAAERDTYSAEWKAAKAQHDNYRTIAARHTDQNGKMHHSDLAHKIANDEEAVVALLASATLTEYVETLTTPPE